MLEGVAMPDARRFGGLAMEPGAFRLGAIMVRTSYSEEGRRNGQAVRVYWVNAAFESLPVLSRMKADSVKSCLQGLFYVVSDTKRLQRDFGHDSRRVSLIVSALSVTVEGLDALHMRCVDAWVIISSFVINEYHLVMCNLLTAMVRLRLSTAPCLFACELRQQL